MAHNLKQQGFSLLELLFSLAISLTALSLIFPTIKLQLKIFREIKEKEMIESKIKLISLEIEQGLANSSAVYSIPQYQITQNSITFLKIAPQQILKILPSSSKTNFKFCLQSNNSEKLIPSQINTWLAISVDGFVEVSGELKKTSNSCANGITYSGSLKQNTKQIFGDSSQDILTHALAIIPITDLYSIYLGSNNTLRRVSPSTKENQPIVYGIKEFKFQLEKICKNGSKLNLTLDIEKQQHPIPILTFYTHCFNNQNILNLII